MKREFNRDFYKRQGFTVKEQASEDFVKLVKIGFEKTRDLVASKNYPEQAWLAGNGTPKHFKNPHYYHQLYRDILESNHIREIVKEIYGDMPFYVSHSKISMKTKGENHFWHPHQDSAYFKRRKYKKLKDHGSTMIIYLEKGTVENGTIEVFPESHRGGMLKHTKTSDYDDQNQIKVINLPDIKPIKIEAEAGAVVCMSCDMIHQSSANTTEGHRFFWIFEIEPYEFYSTDSQGKKPLVINGKVSPFGYWIGHTVFVIVHTVKKILVKILK